MSLIQRYQYKPLIEPDAIRLLILDPADDHEAPLCGSLIHTTLDRTDRDLIDKYSALSYVWGDPTPVDTLLLDGKPVGIAATLAAALRDMRDAQRPFRVWADALCIHQGNNEEKGRQVAMMGRIYSMANHTVIHLGGLTKGLRDVFAGIQHGDLNSNDMVRLRDVAREDLLSRPWFKRVWTFQELVLSRDPWVQCSFERVRWTSLCHFLSPSIPSGGAHSEDGLIILKEMENSRSGRSYNSLYAILQARRGFGATDPRDLVYAQFGVISDRNKVDEYVQINYEMPVAQLYSQAAYYILETQRQAPDLGLDILLASVDHHSTQARLKDLPSWAPDWRYPLITLPNAYSDMQFWKEIKGTFRVFLQEYLVLGYLGYRVDTVESVSAVIPAYATIPETIGEEQRRLVSEVLALYRKNGGVYYKGDSEGSHARVSLRGVEEDHERLCKNIIQAWKQFLETLPVRDGDEKQSHQSLINELVTWLSAKISPDRIFTGNDSRGLLRILHTYHLPSKTLAKPLEGKRLMRTQQGRFGLVSAQTQPGDALINVPDCKGVVVIRPTAACHADVGKVLVERFLAVDAQVTGPSGEQWNAREKLEGRDDGDVVSACRVVGLGVLDEYKPFSQPLWLSKTKIYAFY